VFCHPRPFIFLIIKQNLSATFHVKMNQAFFKVLQLIVLKNIFKKTVFVLLRSVFFVEYFLPCIGEGWLLHAVTKLGAFFRAASALHTYRIHELTYCTYSYNTAILYRLSYTNIGQCVHIETLL
jgi:hypothetical protein